MKRLVKTILSIITITTMIFATNVGENKIILAENKVYHVPVQLWHSENSGRLSMGNNALASVARVEEYSGGSTITVEFIPMQFMNMNGHLESLGIYNTPLFSGGITQASIISTYQDYDLNGNLANFPALLQFTRNVQKEDKIGVVVSVDAMNQVLGAEGAQNAILKFFWNNATLISGTETNNEEVKENSQNSETKIEEKTEEQKSENTTTENKATKKVEDFFKEDSRTKDVGLYNIDITASYLNPLTGQTADGGTKNVEIGEGMSQGVISPINSKGNLSEVLENQKNSGEKRWSKAQLQRTKDGKLYATVRIHLMNWVTRSAEQGPFIKVLQENGEYKLVESKETNVKIEQYKDSYADYTFEVPKENFSAMIQMYVEPMNRPVRFFVEVNPETITKGAVEGMYKIEDTKEENKNIYLIAIAIIAIILGVVSYFFIKKNRARG